MRGSGPNFRKLENNSGIAGFVPGLVNFVTDVARNFCVSLPAAFNERWALQILSKLLLYTICHAIL